jgi:hypothetical protein
VLDNYQKAEKSDFETDILTAVHGILLVKWNIHFAQPVAREHGTALSVEIVNSLEIVASHFSCLRTCCDRFIWRASVLVTMLQHMTCYISYQEIRNRKEHQSFFLYKN